MVKNKLRFTVDFNRNCFVKHVRSIYIHKKERSLVTMPTGNEKPTEKRMISHCQLCVFKDLLISF